MRKGPDFAATLALRRPQAVVRPGRWSEKSWPFPHY